MRFPLCSDFWDTQYIVFLNIKQFEISKWENTVNKKKKKKRVYCYLVLVIAFTIAWKETDFIIGSNIMIKKECHLQSHLLHTDTTFLKWLNHYIFFSPPHPSILHLRAHLSKYRHIPSSSSKIFLLPPLLIPLTYRTQTLTLNFWGGKWVLYTENYRTWHLLNSAFLNMIVWAKLLGLLTNNLQL